jgi:hypothetical protein
MEITQELFNSYLHAALFFSSDSDDGSHLADNFTTEDIHLITMGAMRDDLQQFMDTIEENGLLEKAREHGSDSKIVTDFWLTCNGHGAGFWDGDFGDVGDELTKLCSPLKERNLYIGDDKQIYSMED